VHALPFPLSPRRLVAAALALAVVGVLVVRHLGVQAAPRAPLRVAPIRPAAASAPHAAAAASALQVVDVEGAVRRPGLVRLPKGSRVADAVASAGGMTAKAERSGVNLAAPVADGQQVLVPGAGAAGGAAPGAGSPASGPISLNAATAEQLDTLPGIGPVTAQKIVTFREQHGPFQTVDGLDAIPGIGPARIAELQGLVTP
jgi:competence protein ComEA